VGHRGAAISGEHARRRQLQRLIKRESRAAVDRRLSSVRRDCSSVVDFRHVLGEQTLGTFAKIELHQLSFLQRSESIASNLRVVDENVRLVVLLDEAKALRIVEPLHCT
jgi:hypothetical protein